MHSIAIIGGGITGLTAAYRLKQNGYSVHLFEEKDRTGGMIHSRREEGFLVEGGPHSLMEKDEEVPRLIEELGIAGKRLYPNPEAKKRFVVRHGKLVPLPTSPGALARTPLFSTRGKLRALLEPLVPKRHSEEGTEESLAGFVRRRLGNEVLDYAVNPFVGGIFAGDPKHLSVGHAFPFLPKLERDYGSLLLGSIKQRKKKAGASSSGPRLFSFEEGLGTLTNALTGALRANVHLKSRVTSLSRNGSFELHWEDAADRFSQHFDSVLITAPAHRVPGLSAIRDPEAILDPLRDLPYSPLSLLTLGYRRSDVGHPLDGFGLLAPEKEQMPFLGVGFSSSTFSHRAPADHVSLTVYIGGARQPDLASLPEGEQERAVMPALEKLLGITGAPVFKEHLFLPKAIPQYNIGHDKYLNLLVDLERRNPGLYLAGNYRCGISVGECIQAGFRAADRILVEKEETGHQVAV